MLSMDILLVGEQVNDGLNVITDDLSRLNLQVAIPILYLNPQELKHVF